MTLQQRPELPFVTRPKPRERALILAIVVGIHAVVLAALLVHRTVRPVLATPMPLVVALLEQRAPQEHPSPLPQPNIQVALPQAIVPELSVSLPDAAEAITVAHVAAAPPTPEQQVSEVVIPARFDAGYLNNPSPAYPPMSRRLREQGLVVLKVRVSPDGDAESVVVDQTSGSARLDEAALIAVKRWKFVPAMRGTQPIGSWVLVPIEFALQALS